MDVNNLTSVYNSNPTLQNQYTLQQYLDLFGGSSTATTGTTTTGTTAPANTGGVTSIINSQLNQGGGGGDNKDPFGADAVTKDFDVQSWGEFGPDKGGWEDETITGYKTPTGWKTINNKNIVHGGLFTGDPDIGDIKGTSIDWSGIPTGAWGLGMKAFKGIKNAWRNKQAKIAEAAKIAEDAKAIELHEAKVARDAIQKQKYPNQGKVGSWDPSGGQMGMGTDTPSGHAGDWGPGAKHGGLIRSYFKGGLVSLRKAYDSGGSVERYEDLIDAFEKGIDVMPGETLTQYINRIRAAEKR